MKNIKFDFSDQVAVISGAAGGMGKTVAIEFAKSGAKVAVCDMNSVKGEKTVDEIKAQGGKAIFCKMDITKEEEVEAARDAIIKEFGTVDILVNVAGVISATGHLGAPISRITIEEWRKLIDINLIGTVIVCRTFAEIFKEKKSGKIINFSSQGAYNTSTLTAHYAASKLAIVSYTQALSMDLGAYNVNVNAICPGYVNTEMGDQLLDLMKKHLPSVFGKVETVDELTKMLTMHTSLKRGQTKEDMAYSVMFLASDGASEITGHALIVDSGGVKR